MENIWKFLKTKQAKICIAFLFISAVLSATFFLQPTTAKDDNHTASSEYLETLSVQTQIEIDTSTQEEITIEQDTQNEQKETSQSNTSAVQTTKNTEITAITTNNPPEKLSVSLTIRCDTILDNMDNFNSDKLAFLPPNGIILERQKVEFDEGESVFDVLKRETRAARIHLEFVTTPMYNSVYIEGINNIYEFDCGELSGWMYKVNNVFPNYGASVYTLKNGDVIEWVYTCDLGNDVGGSYTVGG